MSNVFYAMQPDYISQLNALWDRATISVIGTSTDSLSISTGSKSFTTNANLQFAKGSQVTITATADLSKYMSGQVTSYTQSTGAITVNVLTTTGVGTFAYWSITLAGSGTSVNNVTASTPLASTGGVFPNITMQVANASQGGYLTSTDWNNFNGKQGELVSGTNIKTVNSNSLLGSGDVVIDKVSIGLGNVENKSSATIRSEITSGNVVTALGFTPVNTAALAQPNGVATLDVSGIVPTTQLPAYVDDVLEYTSLSAFPVTGETGKIYVALDTNKTYRWSGSTYIYITSGAVDSVAGKTGVVTLVKGDVGLSNVDNTSDVDKPVSTATQTALNAKQATIGYTPANKAGDTFTGNVVVSRANVSTSSSIVNTSSTTARFPAQEIRNFTGGFGGYPVVELINARGTSVTPVSISSGDILGGFNTWGYDGAANASATRIEGIAETDFSTSVNAGLVFKTTKSGVQTEAFRLSSAGNFGLGTTLLTQVNLRVSKNIEGNATSFGVRHDGTITSGVTASAYYFTSSAATQAAAFTLPVLTHFSANQSTFGTGSTVSNQYGFVAEASLTGATNNYGFYGNLAAVTGRWNLYMAGTANNFVSSGLLAGYNTPLIDGFPSQRLIQSVATTGQAGYLAGRFSADSNSGALSFVKSRSATVGVHTAVTANDFLGRVSFAGSDGTNFINGADISAEVDGTVATGKVPTRLVFKTARASDGALIEGMRLTSNGNVGIGGDVSVTDSVRIVKNITGGVASRGVVLESNIQSDVTAQASIFQSVPSTQAATFTLPTLIHFSALQGTFGAGSTVGNQYGFYAGGNLTGATYNVGFYGNIPAGANRWNSFMGGTAPNYMAGSLLVGSPTDTGEKLQITGNAKIAGTITATNVVTNGYTAGYLETPQNSQSVNYTLVLGDSGKHIYHPSADTTARTFTIPANASVAFPIGTTITFVNDNAAGVLSIAITTDTMRLAGAGTTGTRTLAANGVATAIKLTATSWIISGTGLT